MTNPLRLWLKSRRLSRKAFAEDIELSDATVGRLENGTGVVTTDVIQRVSEGTEFEVSEEDLFKAYVDARARRELADADGKSTNTTDILVSCEEQG